MTKVEIDRLVERGRFPGSQGPAELIETHISWVILAGDFAYKIKKPMHSSFLDFSTLARRKYYCEREIELNRRLTENIYLDVVAIQERSGSYSVGFGESVAQKKTIEYAVRMKKLGRNRRMDVLLLHNRVTGKDISNLAKKIAEFHKRTDVIYRRDCWDLHAKFTDLAKEIPYLRENSGDEGEERATLVRRAVDFSHSFVERHQRLLAERMETGYFRDCHGDLHCRNIFLLPTPEPFDCIEFNDEYRHIDVLNEVAFLCMDLERLGRSDLSALFIADYNRLIPAIRFSAEQQLFGYYKAYRANIRAKVNVLRARSATDEWERDGFLTEAGGYLFLMDGYLTEVNSRSRVY